MSSRSTRTIACARRASSWVKPRQMLASVLSGLAPGEQVVVDGLQKVHPGEVVAPQPDTPRPATGGQTRPEKTALR